MKLQLEVVQKESYLWQSDKEIRQSDEVIAQSDEIVKDWHLFLFGKSMQNILNYTSEDIEIDNKDVETAVVKAVN